MKTEKNNLNNGEQKVAKTIKKKTGVVVSDKMDKTRTIKISGIRQHPKYGKTYAVSQKIKAHDEQNAYKLGDEVEIVETSPISKDKAWKIVRKLG